MIPRRRRRPPDEVERYLRRLGRWAGRRGRRDLVAEAERHLYDATCRAEQSGLSRAEAQREAIHAFGPAWRIGLAARALDGSRPAAALAATIMALSRWRCRLRRLQPARRPRRMRRPRWRVPWYGLL